MTREKNFPDGLKHEPLPTNVVSHEMLQWENVERIHTVDTSAVTGEEYVTELVVYTADGPAYRATWNGDREQWAIGELVHNPEAAW